MPSEAKLSLGMRRMTDKHTFVDTNILVYAHDSDAKEKHRIANALVRELWKRSYPPAVSAQVLGELYVNLERKGASRTQCEEITLTYADWEVIPNTVRLLKDALQVKAKYKLSFWDSLIVAAAQQAKAKILLTEDLSHKQKYGSVQAINPFN